MQLVDKTKIKKAFIAGGLDPLKAMMFRKVAGMPGLLIYIFVKWQLGFPHYMTKQKRTWIPLSNVKMQKDGFGMDPKTKMKALRKLEEKELIQLFLQENSGKAPQVRLLTK